MTEPPAGVLRAIWIKRAKRGPMDPRPAALLVAGRGLQGNKDQGGRRQVTLIEEERWAEAVAELGVQVEPKARRANLMLTGLPLAITRGQVLAIGPTRLRILGETRPCERMDEAQLGLRRILETPWRGGAFAEVLTGGEIAVGDGVGWEESPEQSKPPRPVEQLLEDITDENLHEEIGTGPVQGNEVW